MVTCSSCRRDRVVSERISCLMAQNVDRGLPDDGKVTAEVHDYHVGSPASSPHPSPSAPGATPASASPTLASSATRPAPTRHARRNRGASSLSRLKPDGRKECRDRLNRMAAWDVSVVDRYLRWLLPDALTAIQPARNVGRSRTARGEAWHANASQDPGRRRDRLRGPAAITITVSTKYS
jgi:hypothetical protein